MDADSWTALGDSVPYPSLSYRHAHPSRLATVATLLGLAPAPVERCRVLELGCASGGNLIPMAYSLPGSTFTGIDLSAPQIAEGRARVRTLALSNIRLELMDILDATPALGQFDYVIAHGVYSWVPAAVRDKLLQICKHNLAPHGVAYVSYNTYPGWHMMGVVRDMMRFHTRGLHDPHERVRKARELLETLCQTCPDENSGYDRYVYDCAQFLQSSLKGPRALSDAFLLHDELHPTNDPTYFYQFVEHAAQHGLQYLGEAEFCDMVGIQLLPKVQQHSTAVPGSVVELEQYSDFYRNQMFRRTLLCYEGLEPSRAVTPERLHALYISGRAQLEGEEQEIRSLGVSRFQGSDGTILSTGHPVTKAAMVCLAWRWPQVVSFDSLLAEARDLLNGAGPALYDRGPVQAHGTGRGGEEDARLLATNLLEAHTHSAALLELHAYAPRIALQAGECPVASPVARLQAQRSSQVTNLRHERVQLDRSHRHLLRYLDGNHDRAAIVEQLAAGPVADGRLVFEGQDQPIRDAGRVRALLMEGLEKRLDTLASMALLTTYRGR